MRIAGATIARGPYRHQIGRGRRQRQQEAKLSNDVRNSLTAVARDVLAHSAAGTLRLADDVAEIPASHYTDAAFWQDEMRHVFRGVPLMLAASCEIAAPGAYKTMTVAGVPVLLIRGKDGVARAFLNACTHRGAQLLKGCGHAARVTCPYHAWTFNDQGALTGMAMREEFGAIGEHAKHLRAFPLAERAGLIWVIFDPESRVSIDAYLSGYDELLGSFGFENWHFVERRELRGKPSNWKLAFDAHLEFYHVPVLHRNSFGSGASNKTLYYHFGPHQRLVSPSAQSRPNSAAAMAIKPDNKPENAKFMRLGGMPESEWPKEAMLLGEWIIFPNVSINRFYEGGLGIVISQIFPGDSVGDSYTVQTYLAAEEPDAAWAKSAEALCSLLEKVVSTEDLETSHSQQEALNTGLLPALQIGRNEGGIQQFHRWVDRVVEAGRSGQPVDWTNAP